MAITYLNSVDSIAFGAARVGGKQLYAQLTLTGTLALDYTHPSHVGLDPGGSARDVTLEGSAAVDKAIHGLYRRIDNRADAAEALTVKDSAASTIGSIAQNEYAEFYHDAPADGTGAGWVLVGITTYALS